ncbi:MAG: hypothetical protein VKO26_04085 [Cyanobacteriota bacterium]|nr:hypothetical protein [Cyanobacteriota bacterium]
MSADFDTPPYSTGLLKGQNPVEPGFSSGAAWTEQYSYGEDYKIESGGLTVPANGTVGAISGGSGRAVEAGTTGYRINRLFSGLNGTETELWFRAVIQPSSANALGNTFFGGPALNLVIASSPANGFFINNETSGTKTPFNPNQPNLVILKQIINRGAGQGDLTYGWINPTSINDLMAGVNYNTFSNADFVQGTQSYNNLVLNWEDWRTQGDSIAISTSLADLVQPVPGPLPVAGVMSTLAFSRRLRRRLRFARATSQTTNAQ